MKTQLPWPPSPWRMLLIALVLAAGTSRADYEELTLHRVMGNVAGGAAASGTQPILAGGSDGTNLVPLLVSSQGAVTVTDGAGVLNVIVDSSALPTGAATEATLAAASAKLPAALGQTTMAASMSVVLASNQSAVPVSAASLPLPTGAATEATLVAASAKLPAVLVGGRLDVVIGAELPAGTQNIGDVDVVTLPTVTIGTFPDNEPFNVAQINGITPLMGNGITGTGSPRVTIASDNTAFTVNVGTFPDNEPFNAAQWGGTAAAGGSGIATAGSPRVVLATDVALPAGTNAIGKLAANSGVDIGDVDVASIAAGANVIGKVGIDQTTPGTTNLVQVTDGAGALNTIVDSSALPTGASTAAKQPALGTAGTPSADVISVQGVTSMTGLAVYPAGVPVGATLTKCVLAESAATVLTEVCAVASAGVVYYVTQVEASASVAATASNTFQILEGDGANCATNQATMPVGGYIPANGGFEKGDGSGVLFATTATRGLCFRFEETGSKTIHITAWTK